MVLFTQGSLKAAFCGRPVLFQHSLQSIAGPGEDADILRFLAAVLTSDVAKYFLFHTAANWGTERDKVQLFELLRMPFPLPDETQDPKEARKIVADVSAMILELENKDLTIGRDEAVAKVRRDIRPRVLRYYDVDKQEEMLIEDTLKLYEPSSTPGRASVGVPTLRLTAFRDRKSYADVFCSTLNDLMKPAGRCVSAKSAVSTQAGVAVFALQQGTATGKYTESEAPNDLRKALERVAKALAVRSVSLVRHRGLKVFDGSFVHIIKPLHRRAWTRSAALNDADEIVAAILAGRRG
jgi:hypothetical protein